MDGVLIDSEPFWREAEIAAFAQVGVSISEADCAATKGWRIDEVVAHWRELRPWSSASNDEVRDAIIDGVIERIEARGEALAGVHDALLQISEAGLRLALATSSSLRIVGAVLGKLGLGDRFEVVCSAQDDTYGKPHPQVFLRTARELGVSPTRVVVVEDSVVGMTAAKAARMRCIVVPEASERRRPEWGLADLKLDSLTAFTLDALWATGALSRSGCPRAMTSRFRAALPRPPVGCPLEVVSWLLLRGLRRACWWVVAG